MLSFCLPSVWNGVINKKAFIFITQTPAKKVGPKKSGVYC